MTCTFRLVTVDGAPADPPSLTTVAPKLASRDDVEVPGIEPDAAFGRSWSGRIMAALRVKQLDSSLT
jgi:hypothetical protein